MKKEVLYLILYAVCVAVLMYFSLKAGHPLWRRILDEVFAIFFAICFYDTFKDFINKK